MSLFKRSVKPVALPEQPPKQITISESTFIDMVIKYESGNLGSEDVLIFFCYIVENEKYERYLYSWLSELMNYGVITEDAKVNPLKLKQYKNK